jgi:hypothetical protein
MDSSRVLKMRDDLFQQMSQNIIVALFSIFKRIERSLKNAQSTVYKTINNL